MTVHERAKEITVISFAVIRKQNKDIVKNPIDEDPRSDAERCSRQILYQLSHPQTNFLVTHLDNRPAYIKLQSAS